MSLFRDSRQMRRMLDRLGLNMEELSGVEEVIIKTNDKEIHIKGPTVSQIKAREAKIYQVVGGEVEERARERPPFTEDDVLLVAQQAGVSKERAYAALLEAQGDLAKAILSLTS